MIQTRLRSSFIYLANAVNDLRNNWRLLAMVLAPLAAIAAFCLLPDAINFQHRLASAFDSNAHNIGLSLIQEPYVPDRNPAADVVPPWLTKTLHLLFLLITIAINLVVLVALDELRKGRERGDPLADAVRIYTRAIKLAPAFAWVWILQHGVTVAGVLLFLFFAERAPSPFGAIVLASIVIVIIGALLYAWLYFAQYALIFDGRRSWYALLHSRELMRKRFFKVATRIVVFMAIWSGYNSWTSIVFAVISVLIGPVGYMAGSVWAALLLIDLGAMSVTFATTAFFLAAGGRLYHDLKAELADAATESIETIPPTIPLGNAAL